MSNDTCLIAGCSSTDAAGGFCADHRENWGTLYAAATGREWAALTVGTGETIGPGADAWRAWIAQASFGAASGARLRLRGAS